jgi:hypothetical protein
MAMQVEKWDFFELTLAGPREGNPFVDVSLSATFTQAERAVRAEGFYDGDGSYKVRFMPEREGQWDYVTSSSAPDLDGVRGSLVCIPPSPANHGPVRVANQFHFAYADGSAYLPVGTTCYVWNLQGVELEEKTLRSLSAAPFNKLRMCVFPKRYTFNTNEPPLYPFPARFSGKSGPDRNLSTVPSPVLPAETWDLERFNPEYFRHLERRILDLRALGIEADLILFHPYDNGAWGFDRLPAEVNERYLRYVAARLASLRNVWWSFANEYDLFAGRTMADWDHAMQLVQRIDPYDHLRSIHNCFSFYDHTRPWVTHCSIQNWNLYRVQAWRKMYGKPVIVDECGYEGDINMLWGDLSPEKMMRHFWTGFTQGGYVGHGETYLNDREELWWSKGGELVGQSPARIAFLRQIFEAAPNLTPIERVENEFYNLSEHLESGALAGKTRLIDTILAEGPWNCTAGGYHEDDYFIFYFSSHQPGFHGFNLPEGASFRVDVIDTWNMTIDCFAEAASGAIRVPMPARKYMAVRIQKMALTRSG